jgi:IclR family pca regulon transcriptional regulator
MLGTPRPRDFIQSLEKGLAVINSFSEDTSTQTPSEVAVRVGVSRSTARRILLTLGKLGYAEHDRDGFRLTSKVLDLGFAFLSSLRVAEIAEEPMGRMVDELGESSSMSILDDAEIVCVARVPSRRMVTVAMGLGSRLPAYPTAMGRVLLAGLSRDKVEEYLSGVDLRRLTMHTITDRSTLAAKIERVRADGFALVDQEYEIGIRSIAAPVGNSRGDVVAAVEISCHATRVSVSKLKSELLPKLLATVEEINVGAKTLGRI